MSEIDSKDAVKYFKDKNDRQNKDKIWFILGYLMFIGSFTYQLFNLYPIIDRYSNSSDQQWIFIIYIFLVFYMILHLMVLCIPKKYLTKLKKYHFIHKSIISIEMAGNLSITFLFSYWFCDFFYQGYFYGFVWIWDWLDNINIIPLGQVPTSTKWIYQIALFFIPIFSLLFSDTSETLD